MNLQPQISNQGLTLEEWENYYKDLPFPEGLEEYGAKNAIHGANRAAKRDWRKS